MTMVPEGPSPVEEGRVRPAHVGEGAALRSPVGAGAPRCTCVRPAWRYGGRADGHGLDNCERPEWLVCVGCDARVLKRCGRSSRAVCSPCSETYRRRVQRVALSGMVLTRPGDVFVLTLTAPGDREHFDREGNRCACTPVGGVDLARWNGELGKRWNRFMDALRYRFGDVQYFKGTEAQKRGALHLHAPIVLPAGSRVVVAELRQLAIAHGFGHSLTLDRIDPASERAKRAAWYVAKYVTKSSCDRELVPFVDPRTGEVGPGRWRLWTASRRWGDSMATIRQRQRDWVLAGGAEAPDQGAHALGAGGPQAPLDPNTLRYGIEFLGWPTSGPVGAM